MQRFYKQYDSLSAQEEEDDKDGLNRKHKPTLLAVAVGINAVPMCARPLRNNRTETNCIREFRGGRRRRRLLSSSSSILRLHMAYAGFRLYGKNAMCTLVNIPVESMLGHSQSTSTPMWVVEVTLH